MRAVCLKELKAQVCACVLEFWCSPGLAAALVCSSLGRVGVTVSGTVLVSADGKNDNWG